MPFLTADPSVEGRYTFTLKEPRAAAAILYTNDRRYLVQQRDNIAGIELPGYWGLFGGATARGETPIDAIHRELMEELAFAPRCIDYFTTLISDLGPLANRVTCKHIFETRITEADVFQMKQSEGQAMALRTFEEFAASMAVPGDVYALLLHSRGDRLARDLGYPGPTP